MNWLKKNTLMILFIVKKKLIHDIADARLQEMSEIFLIKNINLKILLKKTQPCL